MSDWKILRTGEKENFITKLEEFYGCNLDNLREKQLYFNENTQKMNVVGFNIASQNLDRVNTFGIYFGTMHTGDRFRPSLEGSKFINPTKNFVKIDGKAFESYVAGENLFKSEVEKYDWQNNCPFLIVLYENEKLGSMNLKDDMFLTYLPKSRKLDHGKVF